MLNYIKMEHNVLAPKEDPEEWGSQARRWGRWGEVGGGGGRWGRWGEVGVGEAGGKGGIDYHLLAAKIITALDSTHMP